MARNSGRGSRGRRHKPDADEYGDGYDNQSGYNGHGEPYQDSGKFQQPAWEDAQNGYGWSGGYGQQDDYSGSDRYGGAGGYSDQRGYADQHGYGEQHGHADQHGYGEQAGYSDPLSYGGQGDYGSDSYGAGGYAAGGYGDQGGYAEPGSYGAHGGYPVPENYGDQGGYGGSGYDQSGYGESGYGGADGYGDPNGYGPAAERRGYGDGAYSPEQGFTSTDPYGHGADSYGRKDADRNQASGGQWQDGYGRADPLSDSFRRDELGSYGGADTGSHSSWAFSPGYGQTGQGYSPDGQGNDAGGAADEPFPGDSAGGFAADSGTFGRPDTGSFGRPDTGSFGRPDTGSFGRPDTGPFGRPDTGAFDVADSSTFGRPDTGSFSRADSNIRRLPTGSFDHDGDYDVDGDRDPGQDTGSIRWSSGPPPLRGAEDGDLPGGSDYRRGQGDEDWRDDEDGLLSRRFGQAGGMPEPEAGGRRSARSRKRRGRVRGKAASSVAIIAVVLVVAVAGFFGYRFVNGWITNRYGDYKGGGTGVVEITVKHGDSLTSLGPELVQKGVIMTVRPYDTAAAAATKSLLPGVYKLHHHMNSALAVQLLLSAKARSQTTVLITEGTRASTMATKLSAATGIKASVFQGIIDKPPPELGIPSWAPKGVTAEGFLFPDTYALTPHETALQILQQMVHEFNQQVAQIHLVSDAAKVFTTPYHALVVASLIQAEGGRLQDFPGISRVVWNRLKFHMNLQFDSTVFYAMGKHGTAITLQDEKFKSLYNTYLHPGLPPGPIGNPGVVAMQAAVHPVAANYLYFITDTRGHAPYVTYFANSLQKFNQLKQKYQG